MLKYFIDKLRHRKRCAVTCLAESLNTGPHDWTGPEIPLDSDVAAAMPVAVLLCQVLTEAVKKEASIIRFNLINDDADVVVSYESVHGAEQSPKLPGHLWPGLVTGMTKFSSIEQCQGIFTTPAGAKWRFTFSKESKSLEITQMTPEASEADNTDSVS